MKTVSGLRGVLARVAGIKLCYRSNLLQPQRPFVFHVRVFDRMQPVPQGKAASNDDTDQKADQEEQAIGRKRDKEDGDDSKSDDERRRSLQSETQAGSGFR